jgi:broad-specificity NMP kinase
MKSGRAIQWTRTGCWITWRKLSTRPMGRQVLVRLGEQELHAQRELTPGFILDHHDPGLFPERWVDLVVVLTCNNGILHERLTER